MPLGNARNRVAEFLPPVPVGSVLCKKWVRSPDRTWFKLRQKGRSQPYLARIKSGIIVKL
ncbi:MAG: hypothetical protein JGK17_15325 [Microcoleus sp. PH2017_10_PVI_O_A]|uniref:hypothetical protein n=1 Tax=unclassified Microcoleus TaxID=2642155 RepID=UPI001DD72471|nr:MULTISPECIES: hypothetical protein [unclassified Microcoleus]MCC3406930.1 hypothetical protein [Microcoleus sp. PH2017_10_PVI_O_A]MCC3461026.1 hypothetical protein [Microcoleus sp. PH2017_11_PCY_U_A]MCC3479571.1 hypothetical protein [Microcoleus sp. PH2017_12_PCY_D_A]MCC3526770.1 hypothetical protein [Microcoleus sp. PH2017_21_RUC_O_A]MCC3539039.1 hypothetical protein [Microcoleus sp. PH2017_22_RUC_O_B]